VIAEGGPEHGMRRFGDAEQVFCALQAPEIAVP
jgi:hypothetical protein